jgi:hypothetical protein
MNRLGFFWGSSHWAWVLPIVGFEVMAMSSVSKAEVLRRL